MPPSPGIKRSAGIYQQGFFFNLFFFFKQSSLYPPPGHLSNDSSSHSSSPISKRTSPPPPARPSYSLGSQVSGGVGTSSLTEARPGNPLLCVGFSLKRPVYSFLRFLPSCSCSLGRLLSEGRLEPPCCFASSKNLSKPKGSSSN